MWRPDEKVSELQKEYVVATGGTYGRIRSLWPQTRRPQFQEEYIVASSEEGLSKRESRLWCIRDALIERERIGCDAHTLKNQE